MAAHERSLETTAAPETVWRIWSDPSTWKDWNPDVESAQLDRPMAVGASGTMRTKSGGSHAISIGMVERGRLFRLETTPIPLTRFAFQCEVQPSGSGGSRISQSVAMSGLLGPLFSAMMGEKIADSFTPLLSGLAAAAERTEG